MAKNQKIKKARTAYILYTQIRRKEFANIEPKMSNPEIFKLIAAEWHSMEEVKKAKFLEMEVEDKKRFLKEKENNGGNYKYKTNPKHKKPLRFRTSYMYFLQTNKKLLNQKEKYMNIEEMKNLSRNWKMMSAEEKKPFEDMALKDKDRHKDEWEKYLVECFTVRDKVKNKKDQIKSVITHLFKTCSTKHEFQKQLINMFDHVTDDKFRELNSNGKTIIDGKGQSRTKTFRKDMIFEVHKVKRKNSTQIDRKQNSQNNNINTNSNNFDFENNNYLNNLDDYVDAQFLLSKTTNNESENIKAWNKNKKEKVKKNESNINQEIKYLKEEVDSDEDFFNNYNDFNEENKNSNKRRLRLILNKKKFNKKKLNNNNFNNNINYTNFNNNINLHESYENFDFISPEITYEEKQNKLKELIKNRK